MKLAVFDNTPILTLQGDGLYVGTPMVFVRLWGCDFHCGFTDSTGKVEDGRWKCDTRGSWQEGSPWVDVSVTTVAEQVRAYNANYVSITGGNPLVQADEVVELLNNLSDHSAYLETQASIFDRRVFELLDIVSLSPKLHDWRQNVVDQILEVASDVEFQTVQIKVVVDTIDAARAALHHFERIHLDWDDRLEGRLHFILLPEFKAGRSGVKGSYEVLTSWMSRQQKPYPTIRVVPQVHKLALFCV